METIGRLTTGSGKHLQVGARDEGYLFLMIASPTRVVLPIPSRKRTYASEYLQSTNTDKLSCSPNPRSENVMQLGGFPHSQAQSVTRLRAASSPRSWNITKRIAGPWLRSKSVRKLRGFPSSQSRSVTRSRAFPNLGPRMFQQAFPIYGVSRSRGAFPVHGPASLRG